MDPKRVYAAEPSQTADKPRAKSKKAAVVPIDSDKGLEAASAILATIERGFQEIETDIGRHRREEHLGRQLQTTARAADPRRPTTISRNDQLNDWLKKNGAAVPSKKLEEALTGELPLDVSVALELVTGTRPIAPPLLDRRALIQQLEKNRDQIRKGRDLQKAIVDELRNELATRRFMQKQKPHFHREIQILRILQDVAALNDAKNDDRQAETEAGCRPWRSDILPEVLTRVLLVLGSERDWDSEISRGRRRLEELKQIPEDPRRIEELKKI
jgi:hypothetical protein